MATIGRARVLSQLHQQSKVRREGTALPIIATVDRRKAFPQLKAPPIATAASKGLRGCRLLPQCRRLLIIKEISASQPE
jgi:hypothetical protein